MRLNKIIVGASAFAMAAALSAGVAPQASASEGDSSTTSPAATFAKNISIDYDAQELTVAGGTDKKISVSFPTVKDKVIKGEKNICSYDVSSSGVKVDLSTLNVTKDNYIKVWGDKNTTPVMIKIPASVQLGKATVNYKDEKNILTVAKKKETSPFNANIQYATATGSWNDGEQTANGTIGIYITKYLNLGATLRVRVAASAKPSNVTMKTVASESDSETDLKPVEYSVNKSDTKVLTYETEATFASKEVKAKVAKRANTPKVKVDYKLGTVTLPKNAMFRVNGYKDDGTAVDGTNLGKWTAGDKKVLSAVAVADAGNKVDISGGKVLDLINGGGVDVRIAATDKKPASNYLAFNYAGKVTPYVEAVTAPTEEDAKTPADSKCDSAVAKLTNKQVNSEGTLNANDFMNAEIDYTRTKAVYKTNGSVKTATSGAITLKNTDKKYAYDIVTVTGTDAPKAELKKGVKTVKASGKDVTIKVKNDNEYTVYVRRAAISKGTDATWATDWVKVMTISKDHSVPTVENTATKSN